MVENFYCAALRHSYSLRQYCSCNDLHLALRHQENPRAATRTRKHINYSPAPFGSAGHSKEELVAEMGSAFVAGISPPTIEQSAAYIDGRRKKLKTDKQLIILAAGAGQRLADHSLGRASRHPSKR
ncbi:MAG: zincin-like metallopeptidase domain-containing protein [Phycisphaerales bacterium JB063]